MLRKFLKILAAIPLALVLGIAIILALLRLEHGLSITLPSPSGQFTVGRTMEHWVDGTRADSLAPAAGQKRELMVWIWYPAAPNPSSKLAEYQPGPVRAASAREEGIVMNKFFTRDVSLVHTHSFLDPDISPAHPTYPVVFMKSGIGALATDYTTLAEDLASHGYIVVGSDSPYSTFVVVFPDGRVATRTPAGNPSEELPELERKKVASELIKVWSADTSFELDQLEHSPGKFRGRLDLQSVGVFGHSFGGATAAQFCHDDHRCKAGIDLDGQPFGSVIQEGITQPFLFLLSDHSNESADSQREILGNIKSICNSDAASCQIGTLPGSHHFNFSDQSLLKDHTLGRLARALGPIDQRRGLGIIAACVHTFFDGHLKNAPPAPLQDLGVKMW